MSKFDNNSSDDAEQSRFISYIKCLASAVAPAFALIVGLNLAGYVVKVAFNLGWVTIQAETTSQVAHQEKPEPVVTSAQQDEATSLNQGSVVEQQDVVQVADTVSVPAFDDADTGNPQDLVDEIDALLESQRPVQTIATREPVRGTQASSTRAPQPVASSQRELPVVQDDWHNGPVIDRSTNIVRHEEVEVIEPRNEEERAQRTVRWLPDGMGGYRDRAGRSLHGPEMNPPSEELRMQSMQLLSKIQLEEALERRRRQREQQAQPGTNLN